MYNLLRTRMRIRDFPNSGLLLDRRVLTRWVNRLIVDSIIGQIRWSSGIWIQDEVSADDCSCCWYKWSRSQNMVFRLHRSAPVDARDKNVSTKITVIGSKKADVKKDTSCSIWCTEPLRQLRTGLVRIMSLVLYCLQKGVKRSVNQKIRTMVYMRPATDRLTAGEPRNEDY